MTRIAHLSDLHFGAEEPQIVAALIEELNADAPDLVAISGDLTMGARRIEFRAASSFINSIRAPVLAIPGNHDLSPYRLWERFTDPYGPWRKWIATDTEPRWQNDRVAVFGLNTARRMGWHWDWSRGQVHRGRLERLLANLQATPPELARVVVAHHPLLPPEEAPHTPVPRGADAALRALGMAQVDLVLAGHLHRGYARVPASGNRAPLVLQGSTATSVRLRGEPNAYNRVTIARDRKITVEVRSWKEGGWTTQTQPAGIHLPRHLPPRE
jgi:3',5'-cyclic AMP phosphodiesterase CpdA